MNIEELKEVSKKFNELKANPIQEALKTNTFQKAFNDNLQESFQKSQHDIYKAVEIRNEKSEKKQEAILDTAEILRQMNAKMDEDQEVRLVAESQAKRERKTDRTLTIIAITIGLLTLAATIWLGILGLQS